MRGKPVGDMTGQVYGFRTVLRPGAPRAKGGKTWICQCVCGKVQTVLQNCLRRGLAKSCGCKQKEAVTGANSAVWKGGASNAGSASYCAKIIGRSKLHALRCGYAALDLNEEQLTTLFANHSGRCDRCGVGRQEKDICVDHCHKTGAFRGFLCQQCNRGLGMLGDDIPGLTSALEYLKQSGAT